MSIQLPPAGSGHAAPLNVFQTGAGVADRMAAQAALQKPQEGGRPHQTLANATGSAVAGLVAAARIAKSLQFAQDVHARNYVATGSPNGPAGVPGRHTTQNGLANIKEGIAVLSGKAHP